MMLRLMKKLLYYKNQNSIIMVNNWKMWIRWLILTLIKKIQKLLKKILIITIRTWIIISRVTILIMTKLN